MQPSSTPAARDEPCGSLVQALGLLSVYQSEKAEVDQSGYPLSPKMSVDDLINYCFPNEQFVNETEYSFVRAFTQLLDTHFNGAAAWSHTSSDGTNYHYAAKRPQNPDQSPELEQFRAYLKEAEEKIPHGSSSPFVLKNYLVCLIHAIARNEHVHVYITGKPNRQEGEQEFSVNSLKADGSYEVWGTFKLGKHLRENEGGLHTVHPLTEEQMRNLACNAEEVREDGTRQRWLMFGDEEIDAAKAAGKFDHTVCCNKVFTAEAHKAHDETVHKRSTGDTPRCEACDQDFPSAEELATHNADNHGHRCEACEQGFPSAEDLATHNADNHAHRCEACEEDFPSAEDLATHNADNHGHRCEACEQGFPTAKALSSHNDTDHAHRCEACNQDFPSAKALSSHNDTDHPLIACANCNKTFKTDQDLADHTCQMPPVHACGDCPMNFKSANELAKHIATAHPTTQKPPAQDPPAGYSMWKKVLAFFAAFGVVTGGGCAAYKWAMLPEGLGAPVRSKGMAMKIIAAIFVLVVALAVINM
eukprot:482660_1